MLHILIALLNDPPLPLEGNSLSENGFQFKILD